MTTLDKMPATYGMFIETTDGVKQHGFHLGTDLAIAERFVFEQLRKPEVMTVALYLGEKCKANLHHIYDWRDLPERFVELVGGAIEDAMDYLAASENIT